MSNLQLDLIINDKTNNGGGSKILNKSKKNSSNHKLPNKVHTKLKNRAKLMLSTSKQSIENDLFNMHLDSGKSIQF